MYRWSKSLEKLISTGDTQNICRTAIKLFIGSSSNLYQGLPKCRQTSQKILDQAAVQAKSLLSINQIQYCKAYLKKIQALQSNKPELMRESNKIFMNLARQEYAPAMVKNKQYVLSSEYLVLRDQIKGRLNQSFVVDLIFKACQKNFIPSYILAGNLYEKGIGVEKDFSLAYQWYQKAAVENNPQGLFKLALRQEKTSKKYFELIKLAAQLGLPEAQHNLALYYFQKENSKLAVAWFLCASRNDFYLSMINLGQIFLYGRSYFKRNPVLSLIWFQRAQAIQNSPQLENLIKKAKSLSGHDDSNKSTNI